MAEGVDSETWTFHLRRKDYSRWFRNAIKDHELADEIERIEAAKFDAAITREEIHEIISRRYTAPAEG